MIPFCNIYSIYVLIYFSFILSWSGTLLSKLQGHHTVRVATLKTIRGLEESIKLISISVCESTMEHGMTTKKKLPLAKKQAKLSEVMKL